MELRRYADRVWSGEEEDSIVRPGNIEHRVFDVADGVGWLPGFGNVITFSTGGELILFDTGNPVTALSVHDEVREWCQHPLTTAFYSHGHIDHVSGLGPFDAEESPRPTVIAHEAVAERFNRYIMTSGYNGIINQRQFQIPELRWPTRYRYPDLTYRDALTVTRGELTFWLFHAKGETDDASVCWVPERKLLCCGDLFIWLAPNAGNPQKVQRYPREWAYALRRMAELRAEIMLPSHGAPIFGADRIEQALIETAEWLESLVAQTLELMNTGARLDEIVQAVRPPAHLADRPYLREHYDESEFVVRGIWRQYGGWYDGNPANLKPAPDREIATAIAELAGGAVNLASAARRAMENADPRLACHLAELATLADPAQHPVRAEIYAARAAAEESQMARGIFTSAAAMSSSLVAHPSIADGDCS